MNKPCARITLDLQQPSTSVTVAVKRNDIGRMLRISLSDGGFPYEISPGCYAVLTGTKPDGNILYNHCHIEQNTIIYEVTEQTTAAAGRMKAEIKLYGSDDHLVTSAIFRILVDGTIYDDNKVESRDEVSALTHLVSETIGCIDVAREVTEVAEQAAGDAKAVIVDAEKAREDARTAAISAETAAINAKTATVNANQAAERANGVSVLVEQADAKVEKLREVLSKFHCNIVEEIKGSMITLYGASNMKLAGLRIFGKTVQNGIPTPDAPVPLESVGDEGCLRVTAAGKNLFNGGIPLEENETIVGGYLAQTFITGSGNTVTISLDKEYEPVAGRGYIKIAVKKKNGEFQSGGWLYHEGNTYLCGQQIEAMPEGDSVRVEFTRSAYNWAKDVIQVEIAPSATTYEPYKEVKTLTVQKPAEVSVLLTGIPVSSGGNYTDEKGQQWICDEVDLASGKYVQRCGIIDSYAGEVISGTYMSTTGELSEGATVLYELTEPIAHELTAEELAQYAVLHTNYPNTTIFNACGADMEVKYVADTKTYIDKEFAELSTALLNG